MPSLVVLISGRGSNLRAILDSPAGDAVAGVISDNPDAAGLNIARAHGKPADVVAAAAYADKPAFENALQKKLISHAPSLIALAGFMRILGGAFIRHYNGNIVNIHPSLLPKFPGLNTHRRALLENATTHGCTVHWLGEQIDGGDIIAQSAVPVLPEDDADTLAARVLAAEHRLYPAVLQKLITAK